MVKGIFHININVTNFERSLEFYKLLGFKVVKDLGEGGNKYFERGLRMPHRPVGRAALLRLGEDKYATRIDLIEWKTPKVEGKPYPHLWHTGMCRLALWTDNLQEMCDKLKAVGAEFLSEPQVMGDSSFVCFKDPDGTILELIQFRGAGAAEAA
jgi:glyoxylase I family protein